MFNQNAALSAHRRIHTDEKPFACLDCDKKFRQSGHLNRHRKIHTGGEGLFACADCDKKFKQKSDFESASSNSHW